MAFKLKDRCIGQGHKPFIIAEMSGNHNQNIDRALEIVESAAKCGVDALKLQTYLPNTITLNSSRKEFVISDEKSLWHNQNLYKLYEKAYTWEWHKEIFDLCSQLGIIGFSSPFDESSVDFLESLDAPAYKIASFENNHIPLIQKVASTGKPVIISTGMASVGEIEMAVDSARSSGCSNICLLKCTSTYPSDPLDSNIRTIPHMRQLFNCEVGLSDHTLGIGAALGAVALGASVIEKHFTLNRNDGGVDSEFSLEPSEMESLVLESSRLWQALGGINYGCTQTRLRVPNYAVLFTHLKISKRENYYRKII